MSAELTRILQTNDRPRILLVGDMILDRYQHGVTRRISPEAPIPVMEARSQELRLGGCGNVAANLGALGCETRCVAIVGDDGAADSIRALLKDAGCPADDLVVDPSRPTIRKTRIVAQNQQLLRLDEERVGPPPADVEARLLAQVDALADQVDMIVISDYGKGVLTPAVLGRLCRTPREVRVLVDPKGTDYSRYRGASLITPNRLEAETATGLELTDAASISAAAQRLCELADLEAAIITLGPGGMVCRVADGGQEWSIPARARSVYDVTGAGDTVISVLAWSLAVGAGLEDAMRLANVGAGLTVQRFGVAAISRSDIEAALDEAGRMSEKLLDRDALLSRLKHERLMGRRIVFTNGCFDVLHVGHLQYLQEARSYGDVLVVGVNSDESVRRLKGPERPVNTVHDRMTLLAGLECVSLVTRFEEDTPLELIEAVTPDVLVKGEDWADKGVVGREWVEQHGGQVVLARLKDGYSTTNTLTRLQEERP